MCAVLLPPGVNTIAVNTYISYHISHYKLLSWYLEDGMDKTLASIWSPPRRIPGLNVYPELQVGKPRPFFQAILPLCTQKDFWLGMADVDCKPRGGWVLKARIIQFFRVFPRTVTVLLSLKCSVSVSCKIRFGTPNVPFFFPSNKMGHS